MIFELYTQKIEITVDRYDPPQIQTMIDPPFDEEWFFSGMIVDKDGNDICKCPEELLDIYHKEIIEAVKEDRE